MAGPGGEGLTGRLLEGSNGVLAVGQDVDGRPRQRRGAMADFAPYYSRGLRLGTLLGSSHEFRSQDHVAVTSTGAAKFHRILQHGGCAGVAPARGTAGVTAVSRVGLGAPRR